MSASSIDSTEDAVHADELSRYRSIHPMAVAAFLLGAGSSLALCHVVLWVLPIIGILVGLLAMRRVRSTESGGLGVARSAIYLSCLFGIWAVSAAIASDMFLKVKATSFADAWMDLIEHGKLHQAHQWTLSALLRVQDPTLVDYYYEGNNDGKKSYTKFLEDGEMPYLSKLPTGSKIENRGVSSWSSSGNQSVGTVQYDVIEGETRRPVVVTLSRSRNSETKQIEWRVLAVTKPGDPPPAF